MNCAYCKYNDQMVYTSDPPKYRCAVTGEYHLALDDCNVEFEPVKHGRWILRRVYEDEYGNGQFNYVCSECGAPAYEFSQPYCHKCGARMDEVEE